MRIVNHYNLHYHIENNCALLVQISNKLIVVGSCSHGIQDKVCWQCLFCIMRQQHCWSSFTFGQNSQH